MAAAAADRERCDQHADSDAARAERHGLKIPALSERGMNEARELPSFEAGNRSP
jgi:hypothetical protein